jgi:hypothetical protein
MRDPIELEDIEAMRREVGIDDAELRRDVRRLQVGSSVRLTARLGARPFPGVGLLVRITSIQGSVFRGRVTRGAEAPGLARLRAGALLTFTANHIHSVALVRTGKAHRGQTAGAPAQALT